VIALTPWHGGAICFAAALALSLPPREKISFTPFPPEEYLFPEWLKSDHCLLWENVKLLIQVSDKAYIIFDDTV
jgi:hypothetical protein